MIIKLKKFLIYGIKQQLDVFFKAAQEKGFIEFIGAQKKIKRLSNTVREYVNAIKILKNQPQQHQTSEKTPSKALVKKILHLNQSLEKLYEENRIIDAEIMRIGTFGDFSKEDLLDLENSIHMYFQFFTIKKSKREKVKLPPELIYINSAYDLDYFITINKEKKSYSKMIELFIDVPLSVLKQRKHVIEKQVIKTQKELKQLAAYLKYLNKELVKELNVFHLGSAKEDAFFTAEENIFTIEAWIPENKIDKLKLLTKSLSVNFAEIAIEKKDRIPTYLENKHAAKIGEDLVNIYDVPATTDKDPSLWVLVFFAAFFALIVSDAGYGLLYFLIAIFLKIKFKKAKPVLNRFIKLIMILATSCIIWGALSGSFFGVGPNPKSPLNKITFLNVLATKKAEYHLKQKDDVYDYWVKKYPNIRNAKDGDAFLASITKKEEGTIKYLAFDAFKNNILMELSLIIGVLHISISFLRYLKRHFAGIGWVCFMIGGYLYFPSILNATSLIHFLNILSRPSCFFIGKILLFVGIILSIVLAIVQKRVKGFVEITNLVGVFADVLSYLRLYALGLAGMIMATTFNSLGVSMGLAFGFLVIIVGHVVNLSLAIMGGVIHGLRLNFIEWYHYSFEGDGKLFDPLKLLK